MSTEIVQAPGKSPYKRDNTRDWVETFGRKNGLLKPAFLMRYATDTNYMRNTNRSDLYSTGRSTQTKALMNLALPCQRMPGVLSWSVNESTAVTQTAQCEILNALPVSQHQTVLTSDLAGGAHSPVIVRSYVQDALGVLESVPGGTQPVNTRPDKFGYPFDETNVQYRTFAPQIFSVADATKFPDPAIPANDADNDVGSGYPTSIYGIGSYFLLIGTEVVRVIAKTDGVVFTIPPGGRNIGNDSEYIQEWPAGTPVKLLGFGPYTGDWAGLGYLNIDDYKPQQSLVRPGTCFTTYEGWGEIANNILSHDGGPNYAFTGYWFVAGAEPNMGDDGIPKISLDLRGPGYMYEKQTITPDILRRAKTQFGQWRVGEMNQTIWGAAGATRDIPGDWVDYDSWDPSLPSSYPLTIKTELSQHQEFYNHMVDSEQGVKCELCLQEHKDWLATHQGGGKNAYLEQRAVGKHIYKSSIRVLREEGGPIKTYIRLMATLAAASWDHPAYGTELAQAFTKLPSNLFTNLMALDRGLVFNGQMNLELSTPDSLYKWQGYQDMQIKTKRSALTCPYTSTYDKAPFSQPMQDLAEINGNVFWVTRKGEAVFVPRLFNFRPFGEGGEWTQSYGGSISQYSHSISADDVVTQCWVTGTSAFGSQLTMIAAGTGWTGSGRTSYAPLAGNRQGLGFTSGVQQVDTISMDNVTLGLDWNTDANGYGTVQKTANGSINIMNSMPPLYDGSPAVGASSAAGHTLAVKRIQDTIQFFLTRRYFMMPDPKGGLPFRVINNNGKWDDITTVGVKQLQQFVGDSQNDGVYHRSTYLAIKNYLDTHEHFVEFDIWWYAYNYWSTGDGWERYLSAITGVPIVLGKGTTDDGNGGKVNNIDAIETQQAVGDWTRTFAKSIINVGNRRVDDSINKAVVRTIASNMADPRIQPADVIWCEVPGFLGTRGSAPYTNGIYVQQIQRTMDLQAGTYTATYSGYRYIGDNKQGLSRSDVTTGYTGILKGLNWST